MSRSDQMYLAPYSSVMFDDYTAWVKTKEKVVPELVMDSEVFGSMIDMAAACGNVIDTFKKLLLGRAVKGMQLQGSLAQLRYAVRCVEDALYTDNLRDAKKIPVNTRLYHAALGKFGEAAELLAAVGKQAANGGHLDTVNVVEELGDDAFYDAMAHDSIGLPKHVALARNNAKLEQRYPEGYTNEASANRDTAAERVALEGR